MGALEHDILLKINALMWEAMRGEHLSTKRRCIDAVCGQCKAGVPLDKNCDHIINPQGSTRACLAKAIYHMKEET